MENEDSSVHPKTFVYGLEINGTFKAYKEDDLIALKQLEDTVGGVKIKITRANVGTVSVANLDTDEKIVAERGFWFAWYAFHPETELFLP